MGKDEKEVDSDLEQMTTIVGNDKIVGEETGDIDANVPESAEDIMDNEDDDDTND